MRMNPMKPNTSHKETHNHVHQTATKINSNLRLSSSALKTTVFI